MSSTTEMIDTLLAKAMTLNKRVDCLEAVKLRTDICEIMQRDPKDTSNSDILRTIREYEEFTNMNMDEWDVVQGVAHGGREHEDEIRRLQAENEKLKEEIVKIKADQMTIFDEAQESMVDDDDERIEHMLGCEHSERADAVEKLKEDYEKLKRNPRRHIQDLKGEVQKYKSGFEIYKGDNKKLKAENKKLKAKSESYFQAWLYYWSGAKLGKEYPGCMSAIEDGKYVKLLEEETDEEDEVDDFLPDAQEDFEDTEELRNCKSARWIELCKYKRRYDVINDWMERSEFWVDFLEWVAEYHSKDTIADWPKLVE